MARQNIQFRGLRHSPSDITGQDGDLLECANLIHENGELKPIELPVQTTLQMGSGFVLAAVHNTVQVKLFVSVKVETVSGVTTSTLAAVNEAGVAQYFGDQEDTKEIEGEAVQWVETIGNTLIVGTDKSTHYALYKNGQYKWLGDKLPQPVFEFDLGDNVDEECYYKEVFEPNPYCVDDIGHTVDGGGMHVDHIVEMITPGPPAEQRYSYRMKYQTGENKKILRDNLRSKMAEMVADTKRAGRFIYPFFVRYAIRLFDGNYVMLSAPILMVPSTLECPILAHLNIIGIVDNDYIADITLKHKAKPLTITFKGFFNENNVDVTSSISDWDDIIKGVDLFMSSQIVTYNDSYFDNLDNIPTDYYSYYQISPNTRSVEYNLRPHYGDSYCINTKEDWYANHLANGYSPTDSLSGGVQYPLYAFFPLPSSHAEYITEKTGDSSLFYRVKKFDTAKLTTQKLYLHNIIEYGLMDNLETLPTLPDDYVSRCRMSGKANYNYNQRLLLGNIKLQAPLWYQDAKQFESENYNVDIIFKIDKPEKTIYVSWSWEDLGEKDFGHYLYYPDPDCKEALISLPVSSPGSMVHIIKTFKIPMHEHTGLNGAYALMPALQSLYEAADGEEFEEYTDTLPTPSTAAQRYYQQPNTIAMSSVANPFHFPATNFKDIGRTKVIGMAANTLDVSSGQWGQYPLYVFCSDGIIAVVIDGEGKFGGIQAVSADVLREPQSISRPTLVQTGQALMFLTQRGVMMIAGTKIECMSEVMNGRQFNLIGAKSDLLPINSILYNIGAFGDLITQTSDSTPFNEFAKTGFLAYDYAHHRVLLLNAYKYYQYVFSLKTGLWSKQIVYTNGEALQLPEQRGASMPTDLTLTKQMMKSTVNNYTEMYLQDAAGYLYRTMEVTEENDSKNYFQYGYLVSRPIRFGTDEYKTLTRLLHRFTHYNEYCFVKLALYGSRDGVKYGRINTLRGMSYQYFIFVIYTYLKPNERYSYLTVDFETRLTNKLR